MLHIEYVPDNFYKEGIVYLNNRKDIQMDFCRILEGIPMFYEENPLRSELICRYLKEVWDVEWNSDYTFYLDAHGEKRTVFATWISSDLQATILLLHYYEESAPIMLHAFIPYVENLVWVSKNIDMTVYIRWSAEHFIPCDDKEKNIELYRSPGIFDFIWRGQHYDCSCLDFEFSILEGYMSEQRKLTKEKEDACYQKYMREELLSSGEKTTVSLEAFVKELDKDNCWLAGDLAVINELKPLEASEISVLCDRDYSLFKSFYCKYYHLYMIYKKKGHYYLYEINSVKNPTIPELIACHCLGNTWLEESRISEDRQRMEWAEEVLLFSYDGSEECADGDVHKKYLICMRYQKERQLLSIYNRAEGLQIFHEWYQASEPFPGQYAIF